MFDQLGIVGISWRTDAVESLEAFALPTGNEEGALADFAERNGLTELAYLSTCNRVELIFARGASSPLHVMEAVRR